MLPVQRSQESEFKRRTSNLLEQKLEEICGNSLLWLYIVVSSTKFGVSHHQDDWITEQYAFAHQQFALHEENTELTDIKLFSDESHFHLDSCSIEHSARVWPSETQGAPKDVTIYRALSSDEMSDTAFFKGIARSIQQILQLQPSA